MLNETTNNGLQILNFNAAAFGLNAIKRAACRFGSLFFVLIEQYEHKTEVQLVPKECCTSSSAYVSEFCNEVLDQELRERVAAEMTSIRGILLAQAFSSRTDRALTSRLQPLIH